MVLRIVATLAATGVLAACGFKGPLYLPESQGQGPAQSAPPAPNTAPIPPADYIITQ
ncbi:LPS translocon maturation chaperone LptM [Bordetella sp. 2513F-2]